MSKRKIEVKGITISIDDTEDYVNLTDIARQSDKDEPRFLIMYWLKNQSTIEFLTAWESLHNPEFIKGGQMATFKEKFSGNRNALTPQKWISETGAIGLKSKSGRGGGTFAHKDIALNFAYWLSPTFQVYLIKEFQRLKENEKTENTIDWAIKKLADSTQQNAVLLEMLKEIREEQALKDGREKRF